MYIYNFFEAVIIIMHNYFPKIIKNTFFLLCKFFAAISVASSVQELYNSILKYFTAQPLIKLSLN